jgi:hypothetical protein
MVFPLATFEEADESAGQQVPRLCKGKQQLYDYEDLSKVISVALYAPFGLFLGELAGQVL